MRAGGDAAPAGVVSQATHPGGAGAPPGGTTAAPPGSWLTAGRSTVCPRPGGHGPKANNLGGASFRTRAETKRSEESAARRRDENAAMARRPPRLLRRGLPAEARRAKAGESGLPGALAKNTGDGAWLNTPRHSGARAQRANPESIIRREEKQRQPCHIEPLRRMDSGLRPSAGPGMTGYGLRLAPLTSPKPPAR